MAVWGIGGIVEALARCPICSVTVVGLKHLLEECPGTRSQRERLPRCAQGREEEWSLQGGRGLEQLRDKVRFVGTCLVILVHELRRSPGETDRLGEMGGTMPATERGGSQGWVARRPSEVRGSHLGDGAPFGRVSVLRPRRLNAV